LPLGKNFQEGGVNLPLRSGEDLDGYAFQKARLIATGLALHLIELQRE